VLSGDLFTEPASTRDVAAALFVSEAAVKQHLLRLYDKFGLLNDGERRRARLANEAVRRGAVSIADLRSG
jgi:DNA-binding CsgD family transcriptional regulator